GFALLGAAELPLLRQLSVFICAGLLGALVAALLYVAQQRSPGIAPRQLAFRVSRRAAAALTIGVLLSAAGMMRIDWRDDVRDLQIENAELRDNDAAVRAAFGEDSARSVYLVHADNAVEARAQLEQFEDWHRRAFPETRRSEEHTSELQSRENLVCRLLLE